MLDKSYTGVVFVLLSCSWGEGATGYARNEEQGRGHRPVLKMCPCVDVVCSSVQVLFTGHSMGGHGCLVFGPAYADRAVASMCAAGWISMYQCMQYPLSHLSLSP